MRVLIIDDDEIARELLRGVLEQSGCSVFELPSPIGATRKVIEEEIDVVVLDVMMPEISGDKLAKMLRGNSKMRRVGIILVSSLDPLELRKLQLASGADDIVQKSRIRKDLAVAVARAGRANTARG
jgi:DNA-binding response OmpR family regulator